MLKKTVFIAILSEFCCFMIVKMKHRRNMLTSWISLLEDTAN